MKHPLLSNRVLLSMFCTLFFAFNLQSEVTSHLISVKTADVANHTNTHKQWQFEAVNYRMYNTVAGKYLTGHADGSVTLEAKDETSTAANQFWSVNLSGSGHIALRNKGTGLSGATNYRSDLEFVYTNDPEALGSTTIPVNLTTLDGPGSALLKLDAATLIPVPGTSYTINTINWYTRSIIANAGNTTVEAIDNNGGTAYAQWQFEEVASDPAYPVMSYNIRIYNTKAGKYLTSQNNAGVYIPVLATKDQTATAAMQYWNILAFDAYGTPSQLIRNYGAGGINDLNQGIPGADLVASGTHEVNQTTINGNGGALLQLDDNTVKSPVPGTSYSIQSIIWYLRSIIYNEQLTTVYPPVQRLKATCIYANGKIGINEIVEPVNITLYSVTGNIISSHFTTTDIVLPIKYKGVVFVKVKSLKNEATFKLLTF